MGLEDNYRKWTCDKCGTVEHILKNAPQEATWEKANRVDANGITTTRYYCPNCRPSYQALAQKEDEAFNKWLAGKDE